MLNDRKLLRLQNLSLFQQLQSSLTKTLVILLDLCMHDSQTGKDFHVQAATLK